MLERYRYPSAHLEVGAKTMPTKVYIKDEFLDTLDNSLYSAIHKVDGEPSGVLGLTLPTGFVDAYIVEIVKSLSELGNGLHNDIIAAYGAKLFQYAPSCSLALDFFRALNKVTPFTKYDILITNSGWTIYAGAELLFQSKPDGQPIKQVLTVCQYNSPELQRCAASEPLSYFKYVQDIVKYSNKLTLVDNLTEKLGEYGNLANA